MILFKGSSWDDHVLHMAFQKKPEAELLLKKTLFLAPTILIALVSGQQEESWGL